MRGREMAKTMTEVGALYDPLLRGVHLFTLHPDYGQGQKTWQMKVYLQENKLKHSDDSNILF